MNSTTAAATAERSHCVNSDYQLTSANRRFGFDKLSHCHRIRQDRKRFFERRQVIGA